MGLVAPKRGEIQFANADIGAGPLGDRARRRRFRAGGARHIPKSDGRGKSRLRRARRRRRAPRLDARSRVRPVSAPGRTAHELGRPIVRRRAADAHRRPRADEQSLAPLGRRGDRGPRAARARRHLAHAQTDRRPRRRDRRRRQEPRRPQEALPPPRHPGEGRGRVRRYLRRPRGKRWFVRSQLGL